MPKNPGASQRDFEAEGTSLRGELEGGERWKAVYSLCALEQDWARNIAGVKARGNLATAMQTAAAGMDAARAKAAAEHVARAEEWQAEIASWATSGAEGLMGMHEVRVLQLAQAWLLLGAGDAASLRRAKKLHAKVEGDANGVPSDLRAQVTALKKALV